MKIRSRLNLLILVGVLAVVVLGLGVWSGYRALAFSERQYGMSETIQHHLNQLDALTFDYLQAGDRQRLGEQWRGLYLEVAAEVNRGVMSGAPEWGQVQARLRDMRGRFDRLIDKSRLCGRMRVERPDSADLCATLEKRLMTQLLVSVQDMQSLVTDISEVAYVELRDKVRTSGAYALVLMFLLVTLTAGISIFVMRSVRTGVAALTEGTRRFGRGDFDYRIAGPQADELGQLARTFNDMARARHEAERELLRANRAREIMSQCNQMLVRSSDEQRFLDDLCRVIVETGGFRTAWVGYTGDTGHLERPVALAGVEDDLWQRYLEVSPMALAVATREPCLVRDTGETRRFPDWCRTAAERGCLSVLALPLVQEERCLGVLAICAREAAHFDPEERDLLSELAADLAFGIHILRARGGPSAVAPAGSMQPLPS